MVRGAREHNLQEHRRAHPARRLRRDHRRVRLREEHARERDPLPAPRAGALRRPRSARARTTKIEGIQHIDKVIDIDQSPIGRTPRSNPATYTGLFTPIRDLFAAVPEARLRGYSAGRFSFNVKGGRCEACAGDGIIKIEMQFLPDVYVPCEVCAGKRYNREALEIRYKGKTIADVLEMTVEEALAFFAERPGRRDQAADAQRRRPRLHPPRPAGDDALRRRGAARQARRRSSRAARPAGRCTSSTSRRPACTSPTSSSLLDVLHRLVDAGNTVVVIEHNLDVVKTADWIIDLGPEGGKAGGEVIAEGTPEAVARSRRSFTGRYLRELLATGEVRGIA